MHGKGALTLAHLTWIDSYDFNALVRIAHDTWLVSWDLHSQPWDPQASDMPIC